MVSQPSQPAPPAQPIPASTAPTTKPSATFRALAAIGTFVVLLSLFLPWLTITFVGQFNITLANVYDFILRAASSPSYPKGSNPQITPQFGSFLTGAIGILAAIILYPISLLLGLLAIGFRRATLVAGVFAVVTGLAWFLGVESLKAAMVQQASQLGGYGGTFAGAISSLVTVGYGAYAVILGGVIVAVGYYVSNQGSESFQ